MDADIIRLAEVDSTNAYLRSHADDCRAGLTVCVAEYQTSGRGCGTNSWESARGQNLLFSLLLKPCEVPAERQFLLSMATSLAICDAVSELGIGDISVKWPNDIYWRDRKMGGMLIENRLKGRRMADSIIGIGLNVNQTEFTSDAPNPVSICQVAGHEVDRDDLLRRILKHFLLRPEDFDATLERYNAQLFWHDVRLHRFRDAEGEFAAEVTGAMSDGRLALLTGDGERRYYAFKEVEHVING